MVVGYWTFGVLSFSPDQSFLPQFFGGPIAQVVGFGGRAPFDQFLKTFLQADPWLEAEITLDLKNFPQTLCYYCIEFGKPE